MQINTKAAQALKLLRKSYESDRALFEEFDDALGKLKVNQELSSKGKRDREDAMRDALKMAHEGCCMDAAMASKNLKEALDLPLNIADASFDAASRVVAFMGADIRTETLRELAGSLQGRQRDLALLRDMAGKAGCHESKLDAAFGPYAIPGGIFDDLAAHIEQAKRNVRPLGIEVGMWADVIEKANDGTIEKPSAMVSGRSFF